MKPQWGPRHDQVVEKYNAKKESGNVKTLRVITK